MKTKTMIAALFAAALLLFSAAALRSKPREAAPAAAPTPVGYVLADYGGQVAVFRAGGGPGPEQITAISVGVLPTADRIRLSEGIAAPGERELARLLEDLSC